MTNDITRRNTLISSAALALAGSSASLIPQAFSIGAAQAQTAAPVQAPGFYRYKVGDMMITAINDGFFRRPLEGFIRNAELGDAKKAMDSAFLPND